MTPRAVALVLVLLALAGCGDDADEGGAPAATTSPAPATTADEYAPGGRAGGGAATTSSEAGTLTGSVGPGFEIELEGADGLEPGRYTLTVDDRASSHNFHLTGPGGVDVATSVGGEGEETFELDLAPGEYVFLCDPHAAQMRGSFTVG